jgi:hypothetical protein
MLEADWQRRVLDAATLYGWRHCHTRQATVRGGRIATPTSVPGWPDLVLWRPKLGGLIFVELKKMGAYPTPQQREVLASLASAGAVADVWKPNDWPRITELLQGKGSPAAAGSQPPTAGDPINWKRIATKLGQLDSDWRLLSTREAEALRAEVDVVWERDAIAEDVRAERSADAADRGPS